MRSLKPAAPGKRYIEYDGQVPHFGVRVTDRCADECKGSFVLVTRFPGSKNPTAREIGNYPAMSLVKRRKRPVELGQRRIGHSPHRSQRMFRRYPRLNVDIGKQRPSRSIFAAHLSRPRIASPTPANHAAKPNSSAFPPNFFSGLLGLRRLRAGEGLIDLHGRRLAAHLMVQPEAAGRVLADPLLRDQGFLSRFLIAAPDSLAGTRFWQEPREGIEPALRRYFGRMLSVFEAEAPSSNDLGNELMPRGLEFSSVGRDLWIGFHDEVESDQKADGRWAGLRDVASKAAEQAARIAGVLTIVDNHSADAITADAMERGCNLMRWYLDEALRLAEEIRIPQDIADAQILLDWLAARSIHQATAADIQKRGPAPLRRKGRMDPAIDVLVEKGWLVPDKISRRAWSIVSAATTATAAG